MNNSLNIIRDEAYAKGLEEMALSYNQDIANSKFLTPVQKKALFTEIFGKPKKTTNAA